MYLLLRLGQTMQHACIKVCCGLEAYSIISCYVNPSQLWSLRHTCMYFILNSRCMYSDVMVNRSNTLLLQLHWTSFVSCVDSWLTVMFPYLYRFLYNRCSSRIKTKHSCRQLTNLVWGKQQEQGLQRCQGLCILQTLRVVTF